MRPQQELYDVCGGLKMLSWDHQFSTHAIFIKEFDLVIAFLTVNMIDGCRDPNQRLRCSAILTYFHPFRYTREH